MKQASALFATFGNDKTLEVAGVEVFPTTATNEDGTKPSFTIRRAGGRNTAYQKAVNKLSAARGEDIGAGNLDAEEADRMEAELTVEGLLVTWKNVKDADGNDIPYTEQGAIDLLTALPDLRQRLNIMASNLATFRAKEREIQEKN